METSYIHIYLYNFNLGSYIYCFIPVSYVVSIFLCMVFYAGKLRNLGVPLFHVYSVFLLYFIVGGQPFVFILKQQRAPG